MYKIESFCTTVLSSLIKFHSFAGGLIFNAFNDSAGPIAKVMAERNAYGIFVGKLLGKQPFGRRRVGCERGTELNVYGEFHGAVSAYAWRN
jgi:hypothetical protein